MTTPPLYVVCRAAAPPDLAGAWDGPVWGPAPALDIATFHPKSSDHRPRASAKLIFDEAHLYALFRVEDRFVRSVRTAYDSDTYKDSCVELFVQPAGSPGYLAFEVNCGGAFSLRYIEDPTRTSNRFAKWEMVPIELASTILVAHSMPAVVEPEVADPVTWWVEVVWPFAVFAQYRGEVGTVAGRHWRANCFKCADESSHPHWASWAPIGEALNFHQPGRFGVLEFATSSCARRSGDAPPSHTARRRRRSSGCP